MDYEVHKFPTIEDGIKPVEAKLCEIMVKYREHPESLDPVDLDWMDWANNVLMSV